MKCHDKNQGEPNQVKKVYNVSPDAEQQFSLYNMTMNMTEQKLREAYVVTGS